MEMDVDLRCRAREWEFLLKDSVECDLHDDVWNVTLEGGGLRPVLMFSLLKTICADCHAWLSWGKRIPLPPNAFLAQIVGKTPDSPGNCEMISWMKEQIQYKRNSLIKWEREWESPLSGREREGGQRVREWESARVSKCEWWSGESFVSLITMQVICWLNNGKCLCKCSSRKPR